MTLTNRVEIHLPAVLDLASAPEFQVRLAQLLRAPAIALDGSMLQHIDTAGIQLLCALMRTAEQRGVEVTWSAASPALISHAQLLGVEHVIRLDGVRQEGLEWFE